MAKKLNTYVHAVERNDKGEITNSKVFGPDDDLSKAENAWAVKAITNPDVWEGAEADGSDAADQAAARSRRPTAKADDSAK